MLDSWSQEVFASFPPPGGDFSDVRARLAAIASTMNTQTVSTERAHARNLRHNKSKHNTHCMDFDILAANQLLRSLATLHDPHATKKQVQAAQPVQPPVDEPPNRKRGRQGKQLGKKGRRKRRRYGPWRTTRLFSEIQILRF